MHACVRPQVYLHVDLNYWPAVCLYESLGYETVGEVVTIEPYIQVRSGKKQIFYAGNFPVIDQVKKVYCNHLDIRIP